MALLFGLSILAPQSRAEEFDGPVFKKGLWRFQRTLELPRGVSGAAQVLQAVDTIRCVDPTVAMKGTFLSPDIASCRSTKAEKRGNRYTFANRCDYLGPVRTDIVVLGRDAYTEVNAVNAGVVRTVDKLMAQRIGDCDTGQ
jgi:hypothetical protein